MQQSVLITGVSGFLGGYIADEFLSQGYLVTGVDRLGKRVVTNSRVTRHETMAIPSAEFNSLLNESPPDVLINAAGCASVGLSIANPALDYYSNTVMVFELLEAIRSQAPSCRFITLSSAAVYGNAGVLPINESQICEPMSPYGFHKLQSEILCNEYTKIYGIRTAIARIFSAYGPGLRRQVIWDIYRKSISDEPFQLMGTGNESRDFIHSKDVAIAIRILAERAEFRGEAYNLASGKEVSIRQIANLLLTCLGQGPNARFNGNQDQGNPSNWRADISRLQSLGFVSAIPLEEGVQGFLTWCRNVPLP
jgi:UDP-glucose 4-epimerase